MSILPLHDERDPISYSPANAGGDEFDNANQRVEMTYPDGVAGLVVAALYRPPI